MSTALPRHHFSAKCMSQMTKLQTQTRYRYDTGSSLVTASIRTMPDLILIEFNIHLNILRLRFKFSMSNVYKTPFFSLLNLSLQYTHACYIYTKKITRRKFLKYKKNSIHNCANNPHRLVGYIIW